MSFNSVLCKYFPNCTKSNCPFYHPPPKNLTPCKFSDKCRNMDCEFSHANVADTIFKGKEILVDTNVVIAFLNDSDPNNNFIVAMVKTFQSLGAVLVITQPIIRELYKFLVSEQSPWDVTMDFLHFAHKNVCKAFKVIQVIVDETSKFIDLIGYMATQQHRMNKDGYITHYNVYDIGIINDTYIIATAISMNIQHALTFNVKDFMLFNPKIRIWKPWIDNTNVLKIVEYPNDYRYIELI